MDLKIIPLTDEQKAELADMQAEIMRMFTANPRKPGVILAQIIPPTGMMRVRVLNHDIVSQLKRLGVPVRSQAQNERGERPWQDVEWLRGMYLGQGLGMPTIAKVAGCNHSTIKKYMRRFNIPIRPQKESRRLRWERELKAARERGEKQWQDIEWLKEQYVDLELTSDAIAEMAGCSRRTVLDSLRRFGIPVRSYSEAFQLVQRERKWWQTAEWLEKQYLERRFSQRAIAKAVGCHSATIKYWIKKFGIPRPPPRGDSSNSYPKEWTEELRESIRERDGYVCALCNGQQEAGRRLDVHHIDQDKQNCDPANLVSLCRICHRRVHRIDLPFEEQQDGNGVELWHDEDWLREQYLVQGLGAPTIANLAGCSLPTAQLALKRFHIPIRTFAEAGEMRWSRGRAPQCNAEWLNQKYWEENLTLAMIGELIGRNATTIKEWMKRYGIPRRTRSEAFAARRLRKSVREWKQGKFF